MKKDLQNWVTVKFPQSKEGRKSLEVTLQESGELKLAALNKKYFLYDSDNKVWHTQGGYVASPREVFFIDLAHDLSKSGNRKAERAVLYASLAKVTSGVHFEDHMTRTKYKRSE